MDINEDRTLKRNNYVLIEKDVVDRLFSEINEIKKTLNGLTENFSTEKMSIMVEIKPEMICLPDSKVKVGLESQDLKGDLFIFKEYYLKDNMVPLRCKNKNMVEYWCSGHWIMDENGKNVMEIISSNIRRLYTNYNVIERYDGERGKFLKNQEHIMCLKNEKYQRDLLKLIIKDIFSIE